MTGLDGLARFGVLTQHAAESLAQTRKRTCDGHRASMHAAGFDELASEPCDDMGDVTTIGEQNVTHQYQQRSVAPMWLSALAAAAATGLIAYLLMRDGDAPTVPQPASNWYNFDVQVEEGGAVNGQNPG